MRRLALCAAELFVPAYPDLSSLDCGFVFAGFYRTFPVPCLSSLEHYLFTPLRWAVPVYVAARFRGVNV